MNDALVGERWAIGTAVFEISEPRIPCWRLGVGMNEQMFPRRFTEALRPGTYLRIIVEGAVGAGDEIRIVERPDHDLTIRDIFEFTLEIEKRSSDCLLFLASRRAGGDGRNIFSRKRKVAAQARLLLDVADIQ